MSISHLGNHSSIVTFTDSLNSWLSIVKGGDYGVNALIKLQNVEYTVHSNRWLVAIRAVGNDSVKAVFKTHSVGEFNRKRYFEQIVAQILFQQGLIAGSGTMAAGSTEVFSGVDGLNHIAWQAFTTFDKEAYQEVFVKNNSSLAESEEI